MKPFAVVILAAGKSSRLGQPKQLLPYAGKTLIEHAVSVALESGADQVIVVLGAYAEEVARAIQHMRVQLVVNEGWNSGMGSSIGTGIGAVWETIDRAIVMLADQPLIGGNHLRLIASVDADIVASSYAETLGTPCLFERKHFDALNSLQGDRGARDLIRAMNPVSVPLGGESLDIDTPADVSRLRP